MKSVIAGRLALVAVICASASCARAGAPANNGAASAGAVNSAWVNNGASACEKYLTPEVLGAILPNPAGVTQRIDGQACHTGGIYIRLNVADIDVFRLEVPRIIGTHPFAGVGDGAYWNAAGTSVAAVKGHTRGCDISVIGAATKIQDEALAKKLGEICNKLFALP